MSHTQYPSHFGLVFIFLFSLIHHATLNLNPVSSQLNHRTMAIMEAERTLGQYGMKITDEKGHTMIIDIPADQGGNGAGFRPMQTVLAALCGCTSADVISILNKQRQEFSGLKIHIDGEREKGKEPSLWERVHIKFELSGGVDPFKAYRAAELSVNKYCSVAETLRRAGAAVTFHVIVNGKQVQVNQ